MSGAADPESSAALSEVYAVVRDALARLPSKYRVPLVYATIDGLDYASIAAMLDVPIGTPGGCRAGARGGLPQVSGRSGRARVIYPASPS